MTAPTAPRCECTHSRWRHIADRYQCTARGCRCTAYRPQTTASQVLADVRDIATGSFATLLLAVALIGFAASAISGAIR